MRLRNVGETAFESAVTGEVPPGETVDVEDGHIADWLVNNRPLEPASEPSEESDNDEHDNSE